MAIDSDAQRRNEQRALSGAGRNARPPVPRMPTWRASAAAVCSTSVRLGVGIAIGIGIDSHHGVLGRVLADGIASRACLKLMLWLDFDTDSDPAPDPGWCRTCTVRSPALRGFLCAG